MSPTISPLFAGIPVNPLRALFPYAARPGMLNLASGHPSRDAYDLEGLAEATARAAADFGAWTYGPSAGDPELVAAMAALADPVPDGFRLLVTSGAQQGVDLALRGLAAPGSRVLVPEPVYPAILSLCAVAGLTPVGYRVAAGDETLAELAATLAGGGFRALYALPTFSNPTGETWSLAQRRRVLELCARAGVPIVEDDPYRLIWSGAAPPPSLFRLAGEAGGARVVYLGSLSKFVAPGLRLGWAIAPEALSLAMQEARQAGDLQPNALAQRVAARYLALGRVEAHLARVRALYTERRLLLTGLLAAGGFRVPETAGGMFLFPELPEGVRAAEVFDRAVARGVMFAPGPAFALAPGSGRFAERARLCFAGLGPEGIAEAARRLLAAVGEAA